MFGGVATRGGARESLVGYKVIDGDALYGAIHQGYGAR